MRMIDADALIAWIKESQQMTSKVKAIICKIESMPDAVEVVRCKECGNRMTDACPMCNGCKLERVPTDDNDYCSYGERKESE